MEERRSSRRYPVLLKARAVVAETHTLIILDTNTFRLSHSMVVDDSNQLFSSLG